MTIDQFLTVLTQCNLLSDEKLADIRREILSNSRLEPQELAKSLVNEGRLTNWQARQLLLGQNAFFLGKYELLDCIGRGGMGVVFKARHVVMDRIVALKIMSPTLLRRGNAVARFNREVKTVAALHHPNIIGAYDADCVGNTHFLVMEFANGRDLNFWLRAIGRMPISLACECVLQAAEGLAHAFRLGMVHRDIKPVNMLVTWHAELNRPVVKILDLGLARFASESQEEGGLTRMGQTIGTPDYIAPEAAQNFKDADIRADIFSLGCALFKLLAGRLPYDGENTMEKLLARTTRDAPRMSTFRKDVPPTLDAIIAKMLARDPKDRFQTPAEVIAAIAPFAASTQDDQAALEVFRSAPPAGNTAIDSPDEDSEGDLLEFFRDIGFAPAEQSDPSSPNADGGGGDLQLAPFDDEPTRDDPLIRKAAIQAAAAAPKREPPGPTRPPQPASPAPVARKEPDPIRETKRVTETSQPPVKARRKQAEPEVISMEDAIIEEIPVLSADDLVSEPPPGRLFVKSPVAKRSRQLVRGRDAKKSAVWDSPLLLVGGGALLLLLILGGGLIWSIVRQTGDELLKLAEEDYRAGSYSQSISRYSQFLQDFPAHPEASLAKVHRGLAQLRQAVDDGRNWPAALAEAQRVIDELRTEPQFGQARSELAALLPKISSGLAAKALADQDLKLVEQTETSLELIDKYVAKEQQQEARIKDVRSILEQTRWQVARDDRLAAAIKGMKEGIARGATADAYDIRHRLLKDYPDLEANQSLKETLLAISAAQRQAVKSVKESRQAEAGEAPSPVRGSVTLAIRGAGTAPGVEQRVIYALAEGAAYGLDATSGQTLWRRVVGYDTSVAPIPVTTAADSDCLLIDSVQNEVVRANSRTGEVRWRFPVGEPFESRPTVLRNRVLIATASGRLISVDLANGNSSGYTLLPQPLRVGPAVDAREQCYYQLGDRANLYVISAQTGECPEVLYLGHETSSVRVSPVAVSRYVIIAENHLATDSRLRVFLTNEQGLSVSPAQEVVLQGHVFESPRIEGSTLAVTTDRGAVYMFQIGNPGQGQPLTRTAQRPALTTPRMIRQMLFTGQQVWVAGGELSKYEYQAAVQRLEPKRLVQSDAGDVFLPPLQAAGKVLFHARQRAGKPGVAVSAIAMDTGDRIWETLLAAPLAGHAVINPAKERVSALSMTGGVFEIATQQLQATSVVDKPMSTMPGETALLIPDSSITVFSDGLTVYASPGRRKVVVQDSSDQSTPPRILDLPGELACSPVAFNGGLLVPLRTGQALLLDPRTGQELAKPFQPPLTNNGQSYEWRAPALPAQGSVVLTNGRDALFRVGVVDKPEPHLDALSSTTSAQPIISPPAVLDRHVFGSDARGTMYSFTLPDLSPARTWMLDGEAVWGPRRLGTRVLVSNSRDELWAFDDQPQAVWSAPVQLPAPLAGAPLEVDGGLVVATVNGVVSRIDLATGQIQKTVDLGQPLAGEPNLLGDAILLSTHDGTLLRIEIP